MNMVLLSLGLQVSHFGDMRASLQNFGDNKYAINIFKCRQHQWTKILFRQLLVSQILLHFHMSNPQINPASPVWWIHFQQLQCLLSLPLTLFSLVYFHHKFSFSHFKVYLIFEWVMIKFENSNKNGNYWWYKNQRCKT